MKRMVSPILAVLMIFFLCSCGGKVQATYQEQYDLGAKYLSEGNYEQAVIAFTAAIKIDPKQADAYLGLADAYIGEEDYENAQQALEDGYAATGNETIQARLNGLTDAGENSETADSGYAEQERLVKELWSTEGILSQTELTLLGMPFYELELDQVLDSFPGDKIDPGPFNDEEDADGLTYYIYPQDENFADGLTVTTDTKRNGTKLSGVYYGASLFDGFHGMSILPELRGLEPGDSVETALTKVGVTGAPLDLLTSYADATLILYDDDSCGFNFSETFSWNDFARAYDFRWDHGNDRVISCSLLFDDTDALREVWYNFPY